MKVMMRKIFAGLLELLLFTACAEKPLDPNKPVYVTVKTTMGDVTVVLYDDTPLHKENFIRLCQANAYEGLLFHRVIKEFVMQGGDPESIAHEPGVLYGEGYGGYTVPAEILPNHFNKRGALIDAKEIDADNPERASAGTQFCFVQGKVLNDEELAQKEARINEIRRNWLYYKLRKELTQQDPALAADSVALDSQVAILLEDTLAAMGPYVIPADRREIYKTIGGVPHLDGSVTIFGEVVEGFDVVEKVTLMKTDKNDRPLTDVIIKGTKVFQR